MPCRHPARAQGSAFSCKIDIYQAVFPISLVQDEKPVHFISLGTSFVLVWFFNLVCRGHSLFTVEKARAKYASALGAQNGGFTKLILQPLLV